MKYAVYYYHFIIYLFSFLPAIKDQRCLTFFISFNFNRFLSTSTYYYKLMVETAILEQHIGGSPAAPLCYAIEGIKAISTLLNTLCKTIMFNLNLLSCRLYQKQKSRVCPEFHEELKLQENPTYISSILVYLCAQACNLHYQY